MKNYQPKVSIFVFSDSAIPVHNLNDKSRISNKDYDKPFALTSSKCILRANPLIASNARKRVFVGNQTSKSVEVCV